MPSLYPDEVLDRLSASAVTSASLAQSRDAQFDLLLKRSEHLAPPDRRLLRLAWKHRMTVREIADLVALNHGSVVRRLQRLKHRLCDPLVVALVDPACPLSSLDRELALAHHLRRQSLRNIAASHGLPLLEVRRRLQYVRGWVNGRKEGVRLTRALLKPGR